MYDVMLVHQVFCCLIYHSTLPVTISAWLGSVVQSVTFMTVATCLTADPGVADSIAAGTHT